MSKNEAAQQAQGKKPFLKVVEPAKMGINPKIENLKEVAEEVKIEETPEPLPVQEVKPDETPEKVILSIDDIKRKAELLTRLSVRYDELVEQRKRMENFSISHDNETAEILLLDAKGETFKSHSTNAISKFIEYCQEEFSKAIAQKEKEMREIA